jgi:hypothetical protein
MLNKIKGSGLYLKLLFMTTNTRGFAPGFVNYKKGYTRLAAASDKVYQLLAHGWWFSPGTSASSTTKTGRHEAIWAVYDHVSNICQSGVNDIYIRFQRFFEIDKDVYNLLDTFILILGPSWS